MQNKMYFYKAFYLIVFNIFSRTLSQSLCVRITIINKHYFADTPGNTLQTFPTNLTNANLSHKWGKLFDASADCSWPRLGFGLGINASK